MNSVRTATAIRRRRRASATRLAVLTAVLVITVLTTLLVIGAIAQAAQHDQRAAHDAQEGPAIGQAGDVAADPGEVTVADGLIPDEERVGPWSDVPAVTNLEPELLAALRSAAEAAAADGIEMRLNSGWRTPAYQDRLLQDAISEHGSAEQAARWVASPEESEHVSGEAIDVGPWQAAQWLSDHGAAHDLCQVYSNEAWHFELRPGASDGGCPLMYADPTERRG